MIPKYKWIKEGKDWVRIQLIEDEIKKPLNK